MAEPKKKEKVSKGTRVAEEIRAKANKLSDVQRHSLMGTAMELIYRNRPPRTVRAHSR